MNADDLIKADAARFHDIVDSEVRGKGDPETSAALRDPRVVELFYCDLVQAKKSVESQLGAKRLDVARQLPSLSPQQRSAALSDFHRWRAGAIRFKNGVEERLLEIRKMRGRVFPDTDRLKWERNEALATLHNLTVAVTTHRETVLREFKEDEVSDADRTLWKAIEH